MSVPLDRLYYFIESVANEINGNTLIYRFYPHGSKNIDHLKPLHDWDRFDLMTRPEIVCYDQEPLNFDLYKDNIRGLTPSEEIFKLLGDDLKHYKTNLRLLVDNIYDKCILLHSEKNSPEVKKYRQDLFIPVYYWNHAILALDWYRYARHIKSIQKNNNKKFLIYNRAWSGTREYRLKLADLLIDYQLIQDCQTSCAFTDSSTNQNYRTHNFYNPVWKPRHCLEDHFSPNNHPAEASADFNLSDYQNTDIEVVLETLFDDPRIHLTEKSLRPIAMGQPFIMVATAGSLSYLRSYGFQTFNSVIDESYDQIQDPYLRLTEIVKLLNNINQMPHTQYQELIKELRQISEYNKKYFFSEEFFETIVSELKQNLQTGIQELLSTNTFDRYFQHQKMLDSKPDYQIWRKTNVDPVHLERTVAVRKRAIELKNSLNK